MDNLGAILGPVLALGLVAVVGVRTAILISVVPGLPATGAIVYAIRSIPATTPPIVRPCDCACAPFWPAPSDDWRLASACSRSATSPRPS